MVVNPAARITISGESCSFQYRQLQPNDDDAGLKRRVPVFLRADRMSIINPQQRSNALLTIGHGAPNMAAALLTTLTRPPTLSVPKIGNGSTAHCAARSIRLPPSPPVAGVTMAGNVHWTCLALFNSVP
jgi:hypothetical protein